ncbi:MAG: hypothetical protein JXB47_20650 [Anaerolineae bacterium]|nr:hypothetical protein [Anaerolineae bacterium]
MAEKKNPPTKRTVPTDHAGILIAAFVSAAAGWAGIAYIVANTLPRAFPYWLFFVCLFMAAAGTALPFVRFLNVRFSRRDAPSVPGNVILRQSIWVAMFITAAAWLRIPRMLNWITGFFLALSLIVIEIFLRLRERAHTDS